MPMRRANFLLSKDDCAPVSIWIATGVSSIVAATSNWLRADNLAGIDATICISQPPAARACPNASEIRSAAATEAMNGRVDTIVVAGKILRRMARGEAAAGAEAFQIALQDHLRRRRHDAQLLDRPCAGRYDI